MSLAAAASRGVFVTLGGQWTKFVIQIAALTVLARLLVPDDYGKLAMIMAVVGIATVIGDFGLSLAAIQSQNLDDVQRSNLFWWNAAIGTAAAALVFTVAGPISQFYGEPGLRPATQALSVVFLLNGLAAQFRAELSRAFGFVRLASADVAGQASGLVVAIVLAINGAGFWALVAQQITIALSGLVITAGSARWLPGLPHRSPGMTHFAKFGLATTATQAVNYVSSNVDSVVIGRLWGAEQLGIYNRAFQIFMLPIQQIAAPITRVALPVLSRLTDDAQYLRYVGQAQLTLAYPATIGLAILAANAEPIIQVVLGAKWLQAAPILEVLAIGGVFQVFGYVYYWIFLSKSRMPILFACEVVGRALLVAAVIIAAPFGPFWVACAFSFGLFVVWSITSVFGLRRVNVSAKRLIAIAARPGALAVAVYLACKISAEAVIDTNAIVRLAVAFASISLVLGAAMLFKTVRNDLRQIFIALRIPKGTP